MHLKGITDEDFVNYKLPSMFIACPYCTFKCEKESGVRCCQNSALASEPTREVDDDELIRRYCSNAITKAIVFGGLEPFEQFLEVLSFIVKLRNTYKIHDPVVIYTGFNEDEVSREVGSLRGFDNIIVKYGRFTMGQEPHFDEVLGVELASDNQYGKVVSECQTS